MLFISFKNTLGENTLGENNSKFFLKFTISKNIPKQLCFLAGSHYKSVSLLS